MGGQFSATLRWSDGGPGGLRDAFVAGPQTDAAGLFYFYANDPDNWEILVKMINGCNTNSRFWVLVSASTGFQWQLTVTNENGGPGAVKTFSHPLDGNASGIADFSAFACGGVVGGAPVRYQNDLVCSGSSFTSTLSANGFSWTSFSGIASSYQTVDRSTLGPFTEVNDSLCPNLSYSGVFNLSGGRKYRLRQTIVGSTPTLQLIDEGAALVAGDNSSDSAASVVQEIPGASKGDGGNYETR